jgi:hypothetical protein
MSKDEEIAYLEGIIKYKDFKIKSLPSPEHFFLTELDNWREGEGPFASKVVDFVNLTKKNLAGFKRRESRWEAQIAMHEETLHELKRAKIDKAPDSVATMEANQGILL